MVDIYISINYITSDNNLTDKIYFIHLVNRLYITFNKKDGL